MSSVRSLGNEFTSNGFIVKHQFSTPNLTPPNGRITQCQAYDRCNVSTSNEDQGMTSFKGEGSPSIYANCHFEHND